MSTTIRDRVGAATAAVFVALIMVGNQLASGSADSAHPTGEQVLRDAAHQASSAAFTAGLVLESLGLAVFIGFLGYLADLLRRHVTGHGAGGIAAGTAIVSGAVMLAVKLGSVAPLGALGMDYSHISPELAQVLNDMSGAAFVISWLPFAIFVAAAAAGLHSAALVGRPTAYSGLAVGVAGLALSIAGVYDPLGANPLAFLLGLAWLLAVSVRLAVRPGTGTSAMTAEPRVSVSA